LLLFNNALIGSEICISQKSGGERDLA
jgi:hypothetical protein